jgi:thiol-disulfide isomerase/thioredoxin
MGTHFKSRLKYYALAIGTSFMVAWILSMNGPRVEGDVLRFSIPSSTGEVIGHEAPRYQNKVRIVNLWGVWCPPCRQEIPHLIQLQEKYRDQGFEIIAAEFPMGEPSSAAEHQEYLEEVKESMGINYTLLAGGSTDEVYTVFPDLRNMQGFPTSIFIGRDGKVKHVATGFTSSDVNKYEKWIEDLLSK